MQTGDAKYRAIESLLPLLWVHLDFLPMRLKLQRLGESEGVKQGPPPPAWRTLDCLGDCPHCDFEDSCKGEWWAIVKEKLRRRYRLEAITRSLNSLQSDLPPAWRAVVAIYVDPHDEPSEPLDSRHKERRREWADKGLWYMVDEIPGDIVGFEEHPKPKCILIRDMLEQGFTTRRIERELHVSRREVTEVRRGTLEVDVIRCGH